VECEGVFFFLVFDVMGLLSLVPFLPNIVFFLHVFLKLSGMLFALDRMILLPLLMFIALPAQDSRYLSPLFGLWSSGSGFHQRSFLLKYLLGSHLEGLSVALLFFPS